MQRDEIEILAKLFVANGVKKIRLTGGEPLVRKDAGKIISALGNLPVELAITTNGTRQIQGRLGKTKEIDGEAEFLNAIENHFL